MSHHQRQKRPERSSSRKYGYRYEGERDGALFLSKRLRHVSHAGTLSFFCTEGI